MYFILVILLVGGMLAVSYLLGQRHQERVTGSPYEGAILSEGSVRVRLSAKFYLVTVFFVIFDLEAVFIVACAVAGRELGWAGYWEMFIFVLILIAALVYLPNKYDIARFCAEIIRGTPREADLWVVGPQTVERPPLPSQCDLKRSERLKATVLRPPDEV